MKRSYMVEKLANILYDTSNDLTDAQCNNTATFVIDVLERAGMQPPIDNNKSFKILENGEQTYNVYEWEPEDET